MNTHSVPSTPLSSAALLREADTRMAQALDNFFQRSRVSIQDTIMRTIGERFTPATLAPCQTCLDWLTAYPDALSTAFAEQFRQHLAHPASFEQQVHERPEALQIVDDTTFGRQLAVDKAAAQLTEALRPEMLLLFSRLLALRQDVKRGADQTDPYSPVFVMRALSRALDTLGFDPESGTRLIQSVIPALRATLKNTYTSLTQYLREQGVQERTTVRDAPAPTPRRPESAIGQEILAHIQAAALQQNILLPPGTRPPAGIGTPADPVEAQSLRSRFQDQLSAWQATLPQNANTTPAGPTLALRQVQQHARHTDAGTFDLAVLDALAGLFEFILDDPDVSPRYKSEIAQLQIPTLRVALASPGFFNDAHHPARLLIDLLGLFSRRFPEGHSSHAAALAQVEAVCARILNDPDPQTDGFAQAYNALNAWLSEDDTQAGPDLAAAVAQLEQIERQELGTLLALENLQDLTARHSAPESVLRRLESAWVPYMASLYVAETGEGPGWRSACMTLLHLFLSLQPPEDDATREARLQSIPAINAELRRGLLSQGAEPAHLKDFFSAITATQECWVRPGMGQREDRVNTFSPRHNLRVDEESLARHLADNPPDDPILQQTQQLLEGDWVDFDPPFDGLATARVAWVGVHGYLLFCDSAGEQRFSFDCERLAAEIHAGRAHIPEQSLTRKAMLRLKSHLLDSPG